MFSKALHMEVVKTRGCIVLNQLPNIKNLCPSKLKLLQTTDHRSNDKIFRASGENIVEKGENAGLPAFSPFSSMLLKMSSWVVNSKDGVVKGLKKVCITL